MAEARKVFRKLSNNWLFCFIVVFAFALNIFIISSASAIMYQPGETLNPACAPTDPSCGVVTTTNFITASSTDTLTNKSGNISQWTNNVGYITTTPNETDPIWNAVSSTYLTALSASSTYLKINSPSTTFWDTIYNTVSNSSTFWDTAYGWGNHSLFGYITSSSAETLINKSGNLSMWTNDVGYITTTLPHTQATSTITGVFGFENGGTGSTSFGNGRVIFSDGTKLTQSDYLGWDNASNTLYAPWFNSAVGGGIRFSDDEAHINTNFGLHIYSNYGTSITGTGLHVTTASDSGGMGRVPAGTLYVDNKMGIGTTNPSSQLTVGSTDGQSLAFQSASNTKILTGTGLRSDTSYDSNLDALGGVRINLDVDDNSTNDFRIIDGTNNVRLLVKEDGSVGIGTTNPGTTLDVLNNSTGGWAPGPIRAIGSGTEVGVNFANTAAGGKTYSIFSTGGISDLNQGKLIFADATSGTARIAIDSVGNVGIGTTDPTYPLTVSGTAYIGGAITATGNITTNGTLSMASLGAGELAVISSSTGATTYFKATENTDAARGVALVNAFTAAQIGDTIIVGPGRYLPATYLAVKSDQNIIFQGSYIYQTVNNKNLINISNASRVTISGSARLVGAGKTGTTATSTVGNGIYTSGIDLQLKISDLNIEGFSSGMYLAHANGAGGGSEDYYNSANISNCHIKFNDYGIYQALNTEYNIISSNQIATNTVGLYITSGNALIDGNNIDYNINGIKIEAGGNDGHGIISNNNINHSSLASGYALDVGPLINGMTVVNNHIFNCRIKLDGTGGFHMSGGICNIPSISLYGTSTKYNTIENVWFSEGVGNLTNYGAASNLTFLRLEQNMTMSAASSSLDTGIAPWHGGTGITTTPTVGAILHGNTDGNYYASSSFFRNPQSGNLTNYGSANFYNTFGNFSIVNNYKDLTGLVIKSASSTTPTPLDPSAVSNLAFWFKADALNLTDGASVTTWTDSSGNGRNATSGGSAAPVYKTNMLGGQPVVRFAGASYLDTASVTASQPVSMFIVAKNDAYGDDIPFSWGGSMMFYYFNQRNGGRFYAGTDLLLTSSDITQWSLLYGRANGTDSAAYVNGALGPTGNAGSTGPNNKARIGGYATSANTTYLWNGDIAEIIVYNSALSTSTMESVNRYLQKKYGLQITDGTSATSTTQVANLQEWQSYDGSILSSINPNGGAYFSGNVGIGTTSPGYPLTVSGTAYISNNLTSGGVLSVTGVGTSTFDYGATFATAGGNVGIGTTTPSALLHVYKASSAYDSTAVAAIFGDSNNTYITGNTINNAFYYDGDDAGLWLNYRGYNGGTTRYRDTNIGDGKGNSILFIDGSTGYSGFSTVAPQNKLDVNGALAVGSYAGVNTAPTNGLLVSGNVGIGTTNAFAKLTMVGGVSHTGEIAWEYAADANSRRWWIGNDQHNYGDFAIMTESTKGRSTPDLLRLTIDPSGNVGIGTSSPSYNLTVSGTTYTSGNLTSGGILSVTGSGTSTIGGNLSVTGNGTSTFNYGATFATTGGYVGIGTSTPANKLDVFGNLSVTGRIGLNVLSPTRALDIIGNIGLTNTVTPSNTYAYVSSVGSGGSGNDNFSNPLQVVNFGGSLYIGDNGNSRIIKRALGDMAYQAQYTCHWWQSNTDMSCLDTAVATTNFGTTYFWTGNVLNWYLESAQTDGGNNRDQEQQKVGRSITVSNGRIYWMSTTVASRPFYINSADVNTLMANQTSTQITNIGTYEYWDTRGMVVANSKLYFAIHSDSDTSSRILRWDIGSSPVFSNETMFTLNYRASFLASDGSYLYAADTMNNKIHKLNLSDLSEVTSFGSGTLVSPGGMAFDGTDLYIADTGNNTLTKWAPAQSTNTSSIIFGDNTTQSTAFTGAYGGAGYLQFASSSGALWSSNNLYWDNTNGRLGIGTTTPSYALTVSGTAYTNTSTYLAVTGGYVGIGTVSPSSLLTVSGAGSSAGAPVAQINASDSATFVNGLRILDPNLTNGQHIAVNLGTANSSKNMGSMYFKYASSGSDSNALAWGFHSNDDLMTLLANGNLGLGTTDPQKKLHISGTGSQGLTIQGVTQDEIRLLSSNGASNNGYGIGRSFSSDGAQDFWIYDYAAGKKRFYMDASGNIDIGDITNPSAQFQVDKVSSAYDSTAVAALFGELAGSRNTYIIGNTVNGGFDANSDDAGFWLNFRGYNGGTTRYRDTSIGDGKGNALLFADGSAGKIGIMNSAPVANLDLGNGTYSAAPVYMRINAAASKQVGYAWSSADSDKWYMYRPENSNDLGLYDYTSLTHAMYFKSGGGIGIGTTTPSYSLTVSGTTYTSGNLTSGGNLSITGNGTSTISYGATFATAGGNVGIGTSTPAGLLHINNGNLIVTGSSTASNGIDGNTTLMLHMNGANASTDFIDSSFVTHTVSVHGNVQISTVASKFGGASGLFDGDGDYLSVPYNTDFSFGTNNFTVDFWVKTGQTGTNAPLVAYRDVSQNGNWALATNLNGDQDCNFYYYDSGHNDFTSGVNISDNSWHHIGLVKYNGYLKLFIDGVKKFDQSFNISLGATSSAFSIGYDPVNNLYFTGYIDELRISKNIARWTADFTPPNAEYFAASYNSMVGINTASPSALLDVNGTVRFEQYTDCTNLLTDANGNLSCSASDVNLKTNINDVSSTLESILKLRPVTFQWNDSRYGDTSLTNYGLIAQEVEVVLPDLVSSFGDPQGIHKTINYNALSSILVKAIQEQQVEIETLKAAAGMSVDTLNNLVLAGGLTVDGIVDFGRDTVGEAKILIGAVTTTITFEKTYTNLPVVTISPLNKITGAYWVDSVTTTGFIINLDAPQSTDVMFSWHAFGAKNGKIFVSNSTTEDLMGTSTVSASTEQEPTESSGGSGQEEVASTTIVETTTTLETTSTSEQPLVSEPSPETLTPTSDVTTPTPPPAEGGETTPPTETVTPPAPETPPVTEPTPAPEPTSPPAPETPPTE